jgi:hypothetical protein
VEEMSRDLAKLGSLKLEAVTSKVSVDTNEAGGGR